MTVPVDHRIGEVIEGLRLACAGIKHARNAGVLEEPEIYGTGIVYEDEVPQLLAIAVTARALEQPHFVVGDDLRIEMKRDAGHGTLVLLARPVDVEIAQPDNLALGTRGDTAHVAVKLQFRVTVNVQR